MNGPSDAPGEARTGMADAYRSLDAGRRRTFVASCAGVALDGMDNAFFGLVIPAIMASFAITRGQAGSILTLSLIAAAVGGWVAGALSDRFGRVRVLQGTILWFSLFSFISAFSQEALQLTIFRTLYALGFGGEMAVSIALVGEIAGDRNRATLLGGMHSMFSVGAGLAALAFALCFSAFPAETAWRVLFVVGALPALLVLYIRRNVVETVDRHANRTGVSALQIFGEGRAGDTILGSLIAWGTLAGVAGVQTWLPTYLSQVRGLSVMSTSANIVLYQVSHFIGYIVGGLLADRFGRRASFVVSSVCSFLSVIAYTLLPLNDVGALLLSIPLGFFTATIYGGMAALFNELYPAAIRGSGVAFCYNCGRALAAFGPAIIGFASQKMQLATAIGLFAATAYFVVTLAALFVPERRGDAALDH